MSIQCQTHTFYLIYMSGLPLTYLAKTLAFYLCLIPLFKHSYGKYILHEYTCTNYGKQQKDLYISVLPIERTLFYKNFRIVIFVLFIPSWNKRNITFQNVIVNKPCMIFFSFISFSKCIFYQYIHLLVTYSHTSQDL